MNKLILLLVVILFLTPSELSAQFDSLIFKKSIAIHDDIRNMIHGLGDQNKDGYDDFLIWDCNEQKSFIFFGGNPVDTIPEYSIPSVRPPQVIIDLNDDGIKDIVFYDFNIMKAQIYYGGEKISEEPDMMFSPPPGAAGLWYGKALKDFDGDGRDELVFFDSFKPYSTKPWGSVYFYNTESTFDTIPHYAIFGDSIALIHIDYFSQASSGDLDGDGYTDFAVRGYKGVLDSSDQFLRLYHGNPEWNLEEPYIYWQSEHTFNVEHISLTKDINKDGYDDIVMEDYGFYPSFYYDVVLKGGSFPPDTIPDFGLNTHNQGIVPWVTQLGDVNGDGFNDFMSQNFSLPPGLMLWVGGRKLHTSPDKTWYGTDPGGFGNRHGAVGDINGDGLDDIAIGAKYSSIHFCELRSWVYIFNGDSSVKADTTLVSVRENLITPTEYKLNDPYPNPFNPTVTISWQIAQRGRLKLKIFDILGREVLKILDEEKEAGEGRIEFDAGRYGLTSGVYLLQFEVCDRGRIIYRENKKLNFLK